MKLKSRCCYKLTKQYANARRVGLSGGQKNVTFLSIEKENDKDVIRTRAAEAIRLAGEPLNHSGTLPLRDIIQPQSELY
jgi:hypothetical protein